jgi:3',5'-cyclic-AMP phosphodiesterase
MSELAFLTDLHLDDDGFKKYAIDSRSNLSIVLNDICSRNIKTIVFAGDYGNPVSLIWLREKLDRHGLKAFYILGNHDSLHDLIEYGLIDSTRINDKSFYYSMSINDRLCLFLDSSKSRVDELQIKWLISEMKKADGIIYVFSHYPILDCSYLAHDNSFSLQNKNIVKESMIMINKKVKIFCGHYHLRYDNGVGKIEQFVSPAMIMQTKSEDSKVKTDNFDFGYRIINLENDLNEVIMFHGNGIYD